MPRQLPIQMPGQALRVLLVSPGPPAVGGVATWTAEVLTEIAGRPGIELAHVALIADPGKQGRPPPLPRPLVRAWHLLRDLPRILVKLISFRPHVLHLTTAAGLGSLRDIIVMILARWLGAKGVLDYRVWLLAERHHPFYLRLVRAAIHLSSAVRVLDLDSWHSTTDDGSPGKVRQIPNMVDRRRLEDFLAEEDHGTAPAGDGASVRLLFLGKVEPSKGVVELVKACVTLDEIHLRLAGPPVRNVAQRLEQIAARRPGPWLDQIGSISPLEVAWEVHHCDVLVLPSHSEGFPNAVLEAMSLGKPVVVSDAGAMPEMIAADSGQPCGLMVPAGDVELLRHAIRRLADDPALRHKMGLRGRARVAEHYSSARVMPLLEQLWREVGGLPGS